MEFLKGMLMNLALAAGLFLPLLVIGIEVQLKLKGFLDGGLAYYLGDAVVIYVSIILSVLAGAVVHSAVLGLVPKRASYVSRRIAAIMLACLLPLTVILLDLAGGMVLSHYWVPTAIATMVYGAVGSLTIARDRADRNVTIRN